MTSPTPFTDRLPVPPRATVHKRRDVCISETTVRLHSELPMTRAWSYDGSVPGPTLEVRRDHGVQIRWMNDVPAESLLPVKAVVAAYDGLPATPIPQNLPGTGDGVGVPGTETLTAHTTVHLHGGRTEADSDGDPENLHELGETQVSQYSNNQRARMLWYHDHAMGVTRLTVHSGLAGLYLIRDAEEDALGLPRRTREIPLLIADRNLDTDAQGHVTGQILHKTESQEGPMEFFGPYTLVNGAVWPFAEVDPRLLRLRLLNGSNARTYRLLFCRLVDGVWTPIPRDSGFVRQIGTDCGLLADAVNVPADGLILGSAERADLLVNFGRFPGDTIRLYNTAEAPFNGQSPWSGAPDAPSPEDRRPFPEVMEFRVEPGAVRESPAPSSPLSSLVWRDHDHTPHANHRLVVLAEEDGMLKLHEMLPVSVMVGEAMHGSFDLTAPDAAADAALRLEVEQQAAHGTKLLTLLESRQVSEVTHDVATVYRSAASLFYDKQNFMVAAGSTEVWKMLNISPDTHPIHVHLADSQPLFRAVYNPNPTFATPRNPDAEQVANLLWPGVDFDAHNQPVPASCADLRGSPYDNPVTYDDMATRLDDNEKGLKDTMRVNPGEMLAFAATFEQHEGRYMYHCHILEHEDNEMMRPFSVLPAEIIAQMHMEGGHMH